MLNFQIYKQIELWGGIFLSFFGYKKLKIIDYK